MQPGFGRTGTHWWGYQRHGVVPDIVTLGKPMANGHPVSGVVARAELATEFAAKVMYFNTFGGNPVSCAAANAVLDVLERERLQENARVVGEYALAGLEQAQAEARHHRRRARTRTLLRRRAGRPIAAARAPATAETKRVVNAMRERGVLMSRIGVHDNVLKIRPPMPFSKENADLLLATLDDVLRAL